MPILKKLPGRSKSCHEFPRTNGELIIPGLHLDLNPFEEVDLEEERNQGDGGLIMRPGGDGRPHLWMSRDGEEEENEVNLEKHGPLGAPKGSPLRGTLERICGVSPLKTLGKLGKGLRLSGRSVWGNGPSPRSPSDPNDPWPEKEKRKGLRRSSEEIMTLLR